MMRSLGFVLVGLILFSCKKETAIETFYQAPNGKIFSQTEYDSVIAKMAMSGTVEEQFTSKIKRNDSIIVQFDTKIAGMVENPHQNIEAFLGKPLPFDTMTTLDGTTLSTSALNGKPTLLHLWFINCPPCIEEIPRLNQLHATYGDKVNFVALTFEKQADVQNFLNQNNFDFQHFTDGRSHLDKLQNQVFPTNIFIDKDGFVRSYSGNLLESEIDGNLKALNDLL